MKKIKPTTTVDVVGKLDLLPEKHTDVFFESKSHQKYFIKRPRVDACCNDSIELLAIANEIEYKKMREIQEKLIENSKRKDDINASRLTVLRKLQSELRSEFAKVNNFLKDQDDKKKAAQMKVEEEKQKHNELRGKIGKLKNGIAVLTEFRDTLSATVKKFDPYEAVIQDVIETTPVWKSVKDCTDRCDALMLAQVEIDNMKKAKIEQINKQRDEMIKFSHEAALQVMGFMNQLTALERDLEIAHAECLNWEKILVRIKDFIMDEELNKIRTCDGIDLMYRTLCRRRGETPVLQKYNVEEQLDFIKDEMNIMQKVVDICNKKTK